jgi:hypothetical protein
MWGGAVVAVLLNSMVLTRAEPDECLIGIQLLALSIRVLGLPVLILLFGLFGGRGPGRAHLALPVYLMMPA